MTQHRFTIVAAVLVLAASGCGDDPSVCSDGVKNGNETDVDCGGGSCSRCAPGKHCSVPADCASPATCAAGLCVATNCSDKVKNGDESDVDCGGACPGCPNGQHCQGDPDCASKLCRNQQCTAPDCTDGVLNGPETDVDCGGPCPQKCATGKKCTSGPDCSSGLCNQGVCGGDSCSDGVQNGTETDVDCAGSCPTKCADGKKCKSAADCISNSCQGGACIPTTCTDGMKNGSETDIDCGGFCLGKCVGGKACLQNSDCASKICASKICTNPSCNDKLQNGDESDLDCGGTVCPKCAAGKACNSATDCQSNSCTANVCQPGPPPCADGVKNNAETDVDCGGGSCPRCAQGKKCLAPADCASNICTSGVCVAPTCSDKAKNGDETDVDCGGSCAAKCAAGKACKVPADCLTASCINLICMDTCTNGVKDGVEGDVDCGVPCTTKCANGKTCNVGLDCTSKVCKVTCQAPTCSDGVQNGTEGGIDCDGPCAPCNPGTCPMLYVWDGKGMQFESDMYPRGMLGLKYSVGYLKPNPHDYYVLRHEPAVRPDGLLDLRLVEERREVNYLDQARLYAVDFPAGLDLYSEILYVGTAYVPPDKVVHTVALPLKQAVSATHVETGQSITGILGSSDGNVLVLSSDRESSVWNTIELDLGNQASAPKIKLIIDARSMMPNTPLGSANARAQELPGGARTFLQVRDASGTWVTVPKATASLPIPKEYPRPFVVDISGIFVADKQKVRLGFLYKTYLDSIRFDTSVDQPVTFAELPVAASSLDYHGNSLPSDGTETALPVYSQVSSTSLFPYFPGLYTAFTDVLPLVKAVDDMFVIFGPGDEVHLRYGPVPPRSTAHARRYLFYVNGYYKSGKATTISFTVAPLPFAAMSTFPYDPAVESYPTDASHQQYLSTYNTRQQ